MGLLAELVVRTYYESQGKPVYHIREIVAQQPVSEKFSNSYRQTANYEIIDHRH